MNLIEKHTAVISKLCKSYKVKSLYAFGSVLTNRFTDESDIDLIVDFKPLDVLDYADNYFDFKFALQELLNRQIDLLEDRAIKNPYFRNVINQHKKLIYGE